MQLRDAEPIGLHDDHRGGVGNVDADLHHRGGHEHVDLPGREGLHDRVFLLPGHLAVQDLDPQAVERGDAGEHLSDLDDSPSGSRLFALDGAHIDRQVVRGILCRGAERFGIDGGADDEDLKGFLESEARHQSKLLEAKRLKT